MYSDKMYKCATQGTMKGIAAAGYKNVLNSFCSFTQRRNAEKMQWKIVSKSF
jgi:transketolase C-terminal domain/subunit